MRDLELIDADLHVEGAILQIDLRSGEFNHDADATRERINRLLDERSEAARVHAEASNGQHRRG